MTTSNEAVDRVTQIFEKVIRDRDAHIERLLTRIALLMRENQELWDQVDFAVASIKRDRARCVAGGDMAGRFKRWLDENEAIRERFPKHE